MKSPIQLGRVLLFYSLRDAARCLLIITKCILEWHATSGMQQGMAFTQMTSSVM